MSAPRRDEALGALVQAALGFTYGRFEALAAELATAHGVSLDADLIWETFRRSCTPGSLRRMLGDSLETGLARRSFDKNLLGFLGAYLAGRGIAVDPGLLKKVEIGGLQDQSE